MGGIGSSRWGFSPRKGCIEEYSAFDLDAWISAGLLLHEAGRIEWEHPYTGSKNSLVYFLRSTLVPDCKYVEIFYAQSDGELVYDPTTIVSKPQAIGIRWYFVCLHCGRRVRKLYQIHPRAFYACRHCSDLTYRSAQQHNKNHDIFRRNPDYLTLALDAGSLPATIFVINNLMRVRTSSNVRISPMAGSWEQGSKLAELVQRRRCLMPSKGR